MVLRKSVVEKYWTYAAMREKTGEKQRWQCE
jgi:hypothetical protein